MLLALSCWRSYFFFWLDIILTLARVRLAHLVECSGIGIAESGRIGYQSQTPAHAYVARAEPGSAFFFVLKLVSSGFRHTRLSVAKGEVLYMIGCEGGASDQSDKFIGRNQRVVCVMSELKLAMVS
jgi:hypothetical protein